MKYEGTINFEEFRNAYKKYEKEHGKPSSIEVSKEFYDAYMHLYDCTDAPRPVVPRFKGIGFIVKEVKNEI